MKLGTYVIKQGDSIEVVSRVLLGDSEQEDALIRINRLRYPYFSDDPRDQFANPKGAIFLTATFTNPSTITFNNPNVVVILPDDAIVLSEGSNFASAVVLSATDTSIEFVEPIVGTFDAGAIVLVHTNQQNVTTQVLRTGDTLLYPFNPDVPINADNQNDNSLIIGTDWKLDEKGYLVRGHRDVATISGYDNLFQAFHNRMITPLGSLRRHPNYGNELFDFLGEAGTPHFIGLAKHFAVECALQDPRFESAEVLDYGMSEDSMTLMMRLVPIGSQDAVVQPVVVPIRGV